MKRLKWNIGLFFFLLTFSVTATAFVMHYIDSSKERTTIKVNTNPKDDVKVGEIALKKVHNEINITSHTYDVAYPFEKGTLDRDADFWDKTKYALSGKSMTIQVYASYEYRVNLEKISKSDIQYDKNTQSLTITLPKPVLKLTLDKENSKPDSFVALFSSGFSEEERLRIYQEAEDAGKLKLQKDKEKLEEAKEDISNAMTNLLLSIGSIKHIDIEYK